MCSIQIDPFLYKKHIEGEEEPETKKYYDYKGNEIAYGIYVLFGEDLVEFETEALEQYADRQRIFDFHRGVPEEL